MFGEVKFENGSYGYILSGKSNKDYNKGEFVSGLYSVEIIGNKLDNPELLENKKWSMLYF